MPSRRSGSPPFSKPLCPDTHKFLPCFLRSEQSDLRLKHHHVIERSYVFHRIERKYGLHEVPYVALIHVLGGHTLEFLDDLLVSHGFSRMTARVIDTHSYRNMRVRISEMSGRALSNDGSPASVIFPINSRSRRVLELLGPELIRARSADR